MVGSEGTLGVINEVVLKIVPKPAHRIAMIAVYDDLDKASETVAAIIAAHIIPATLEFMDNFTIRAVEAFSSAGLPTDAAALLLIETDGHRGPGGGGSGKNITNLPDLRRGHHQGGGRRGPSATPCGRPGAAPFRPWPSWSPR